MMDGFQVLERMQRESQELQARAAKQDAEHRARQATIDAAISVYMAEMQVLMLSALNGMYDEKTR